MMKYKRAIFAATLTALIGGCGGGGGSSVAAIADTGSTTDTTTATSDTETQTISEALGNSTDIPADTVTFNDIGDEAETDGVKTALAVAGESAALAGLVADGATALFSDFEASFTTLSPGWSVNWWGSTKPSYVAGKETAAANVLAGSGAQRFKLSSVAANGGAHLVYSYGFVKGVEYNASVNLKAAAPTTVEVQLRRNSSPFNVLASKRVTLTTGFQRVDLSGTWAWSDAGAIRVVPLQTGATVYMDNVVVTAGATTTTTAQAVAGGIDLPAAGGKSVDLVSVKTTDMDSAFTRFDPGWYFNSFGGTAQADFVASRDSRAGYFYAGTSSQKFQVIDKKGGELHLMSAFAFVKGKTYRTTLYVKADTATPVQVFMRQDTHPYTPFGSVKVTANGTWQKVEIEGVFMGDGGGSVRVSLLNATGTVWVDEMTISEVKKNDLAPVNTGPIPDTLFGMHINKLGVHFNWPGMGTRIIRLWNTATTWRDIEKSNGTWDFARLDAYVNYAVRNGGSVLYTMGQTPQWASSTPSVTNLYGAGAGGAPVNMADWRDYVRTVAQRYAGKIKYWELWNESDYSGTYNGTTAQLVEMARIAREEIKAADPTSTLVSPGMTNGQGMNALDAFLSAGGGAYVDAIGYHWYYSTNPESISASIDNVRQLMKTHGVGDKPIWNTEGAFICNSATTDCATATPTAEQKRGINARALFTMAIKGIANFNFYNWESPDAWRYLVESNYVTATDAGKSFTEARSWASGASPVDAYRVDDKVYMVKLAKGGVNSYVLWATTTGTLVNLPSAWSVGRVRTLSGAESAISTTRQIRLTTEPVLLTP